MNRAFRVAAWGSFALAMVPLLASCASRRARKEYMHKCECGTPEHDVLGCTGTCRAGESGCTNPRCTCETSTGSGGA